jgi:hypothetical protein
MLLYGKRIQFLLGSKKVFARILRWFKCKAYLSFDMLSSFEEEGAN